MKEILTINPSRKKKAKKKRPAKKKATTKKRKGTIMSKAKKRNPARKRRVKRKVSRKKRRRSNPGLASRARGVLSVKGIRDAATGALRQTGGALLTQFFAKRFAPNGGANDPNWTYQNYLLGALGALAAGVTAEVIRPGVGKDFLKGGLTLIMYKIFTNEIAPRNEFLMSNFGQADDMEYQEGDVYYDEAGQAFLLGQDGYWRPTDEAHRIGEALITPSVLGQVDPMTALSPGTVSMGATLQTPTSLGQVEDPYQAALGGVDPRDLVYS